MPTVTARYVVIDDGDVRLSVTIGDAQTGSSAAHLGRDLFAPGPDIQDVIVGQGAEIRGKVLVISTIVVDIRPEHDRSSVTVTLRGGHPEVFPLVQAATSSTGGAIPYLTVVSFV